MVLFSFRVIMYVTILSSQEYIKEIDV